MTNSAKVVRSRTGTRQAIVEAAIDCFTRGGFANTGMEDVAAAAGTSRQTLYNHFDGKQTLITEVLAYRATAILERLRGEIAYKAPTLELIAATAARHLELSLDDPIGRMLASPADSHLISQSLLGERMMNVRRSFWVPFLQAAIDQGVVRDDVDVEQTATWLIFLLFSLGNAGGDFGLLGDQLRPTLEHFLTRGIARF